MNEKLSFRLIIALIVGSMLFGLIGKATEMGVFVVACGIALAFTNIDKIQRFKGAGFEAEMKKAVEDAYATMGSLKAIAKPLILSTLSNLIYAGRWGGMQKERQHELKDEMDRLAKSIGVFDSEVRDESEKFFAWNAIDIVACLEGAVHKAKSLEKSEQESIRSLTDRATDKYPSLDELKKCLSSFNDEQRNAAQPFLEDYEYYLSHRRLRRPGIGEE
jgi:hypothetical protein